uniref:Uncharacterized protein n=1 Tax=Arion vulgaris TaxID=1028688 RepID=A0A0B7BM61_9EUPU
MSEAANAISISSLLVFQHGQQRGSVEDQGQCCCPVKFAKIIQQFYQGMMACVLENEELSETFHVTNYIKQY